MPQYSKQVHGESIRITGQIPEEKPCFVISCNRGEIANDTQRAAKENMHPPIFTVALHTTGDRQYGYVHQSEFKFCIGPDSFSAAEREKGRAT
ncbi:MAG: hypothetical protein HRT88_03025, partial [Lentisphaeraceae bacterium]|nr:hypothetical protein [Lentisphaeraceae bacterium]